MVAVGRDIYAMDVIMKSNKKLKVATLDIVKKLIKENLASLEEGGWGAYGEIPYQENTKRFFDILNLYSVKRKSTPPSEDLLGEFLKNLRRELGVVYPDPVTKKPSDSPLSAYKTDVEKAIDLFDDMYRGRMARLRAEYGTDHEQIEKNIMKVLRAEFNDNRMGPSSGFAEIFGAALAGSYEKPIEPTAPPIKKSISL